MCKQFGWTPEQYDEQEIWITDMFFEFMNIQSEEERLQQKREEQKG